MLDDYEAQVRAWLDAEPALSAQAVLVRLVDVAPDRFAEKHLRTVQRAVRLWRRDLARSLLRDGAAVLVGRSANVAQGETTIAASAGALSTAQPGRG